MIDGGGPAVGMGTSTFGDRRLRILESPLCIRSPLSEHFSQVPCESPVKYHALWFPSKGREVHTPYPEVVAAAEE